MGLISVSLIVHPTNSPMNGGLLSISYVLNAGPGLGDTVLQRVGFPMGKPGLILNLEE